MQNFNHAASATETALNSAGSAARENARYMEGLEAMEKWSCETDMLENP